MLERAKEIALGVAEIAKKTNRVSMFVIENTAGIKSGGVFFPPIRYTPNAVAGVANICTIEDARKIAKSVDGVVQVILVDVEKKVENLDEVEEAVKREVVKSRVLTIKANDMTVNAIDALVTQLVDKVPGKRVAIIGAGNLGSKLALKLVERGADVIATRRDGKKLKKIVEVLNVIKPKGTPTKVTGITDNLRAAKGADILIGFTPRVLVITPEIVNAMNPGGLLIDGGIGTISSDAIKLALQKGIRVLRLDMRAGFSGGVTTLLETNDLIKCVMGKSSIAGVPVVAGGCIGDRGDVITDSISNPTQVIGAADGSGGVLTDPGPEFRDRVEKVRREIEKCGK